VAHKLTRSQLGLFFAEMPPCVVAMEACSSAHHWGETLIAFGHEVRSLPPAHVKPCIRADCNSVESGTVGAVADRAGRAPKGVRKNARLATGYLARLQGPVRPKCKLL
jgi:transposase